MARLAMRVKDKKRTALVKKFAAKRNDLRTRSVDLKLSDEDRQDARTRLNKLPKNSAPARQRNRCAITGRPRGTFQHFGLGRAKIREMAFAGEIPGIVKASW